MLDDIVDYGNPLEPSPDALNNPKAGSFEPLKTPELCCTDRLSWHSI